MTDEGESRQRNRERDFGPSGGGDILAGLPDDPEVPLRVDGKSLIRTPSRRDLIDAGEPEHDLNPRGSWISGGRTDSEL